MDRNRIFKRHPFLKNRSEESLKKVADSFMNLSNKLWFAVIVTTITFPITLSMKDSFSHGGLLINSFVFLSCVFLIFFGVIFALKTRNWALDIYDVLIESNKGNN